MKNLTYSQLIELAPKDRPFQIEVESNPYDEGGPQILWGNIYKGHLNTCMLNQELIDGFKYDYFDFAWEDNYAGFYTLIDPKYQKPEVLKVGQKVRIMESARECEAYKGWGDDCKGCVGTTDTIIEVTDEQCGIYYRFKNSYTFPHYCVMPVEDDEKVQEIPELENTLEQLDNLISKAQDIISKYKK